MEAITPAMLISGLAMILVACIGWWVSNLYAKVEAQAVQINDLKVRIAQDYVPRSEIAPVLQRIFDKLEEIQKGMRHEHDR